MVGMNPGTRGLGWKCWALAWLALGVLVAAGYLWLRADPEDPAPQSFRRVREGMTVAEVKAIAGKPSAHHPFQRMNGSEAGLTGEYYAWYSDNALLEVIFDPQGIARYVEVTPPEPSRWDRLRQRLGLAPSGERS
jgi:hypothetical protein